MYIKELAFLEGMNIYHILGFIILGILLPPVLNSLSKKKDDE